MRSFHDTPPRKILIWKEKEGSYRHMWRMYCETCSRRVQFWFFGATLGFAFEHLRRNHRY